MQLHLKLLYNKKELKGKVNFKCFSHEKLSLKVAFIIVGLVNVKKFCISIKSIYRAEQFPVNITLNIIADI